MSGTTQRSPEDIRRDIQQHRRELGESLEQLRAEVRQATDWRRQLVEHQREILIGAAMAGFVLGGGIAGIARILGRGRKRR